MSHVLIVGQKSSGFVNYLTDHGHTYTFIQDRAATKFPDKRFKHRILADFSSQDDLFASIDNLKIRPDAVVATYETYILDAARIANHLNLPGLPMGAAYACTDKYIMRSLFSKAPEKISPDFAEAGSEDDVRRFATTHSFPLILKPANLAKSLLVTKNLTLDELIANYQKSVSLIQDIYKKYAPNRQPKLIIEEFLEGSIHSVDAYVDADGTPNVLQEVVDYQTGYDIGFDDNFHYSRTLPSKLNQANQQALRHCAEVGVRALGIRNSPAHVEIIFTADGPRIVEIGARNGGYRDRMHALANGIDIVGSALLIHLGKMPDVRATKHNSCCVLELFPKQPGVIIGINNEDMLRSLPSLNYYARKKKNGESTGKAADGFKATAIIVLYNDDSEQFNRDLAFVNSSVFVETASHS